jgi:DNA repair ATPase RecN
MATEMVPERCAEHSMTEAEILNRLKVLEDDVKELYAQLKDKVDTTSVRDIVERSTKEIEEIKKAILRLDAADARHSEALAGIHQILKGFKETQDLLRQDYSKLADCYTQTSIHIASITTILAERAKQEEGKAVVVKDSDEKKAPWYAKLLQNKAVIATVIGFVFFIVTLILTHTQELFDLFGAIFGK